MTLHPVPTPPTELAAPLGTPGIAALRQERELRRNAEKFATALRGELKLARRELLKLRGEHEAAMRTIRQIALTIVENDTKGTEA